MDELEHNPFLLAEQRLAERKELMLDYRKRKAKLDAVGVSKAVTLGDIQFALVQSKGVLVKAAEMLGMTRPQLRRKVDTTPSLRLLMKNIEEENIDLAEHELLQSAHNGYYPAVSFLLKTKGAKRGYSERATVEHEMGENMAKNAAALIEAMKRGALQLEDAPTINSEDYTWVDEPLPENQDQTS